MEHELCDAHGHVWTTADEYPWVAPVTPPGATRMVYSLEDYRDEMATLGVERAMLVATPIHGPGSPYTVDCVEAHPETFYGIVLVDHDANDVETHLDQVFRHENVLGVRMTADDVADSSPAFWSWMDHHGKQVHLLVGPDEIDEAVPYIQANANVDFVFDHLALYPAVEDYRPDRSPYAEMETVAAHANTYVKVTHTPSRERFPFPDVHDHVRFLLEAFGPDRLVWGSDYVYHFDRVTPWQTLEFLEELPFLSDRDRRALRSGTFQDLVSRTVS